MTPDTCPGDGEPCYVDKDPDEAHFRCGTVQCAGPNRRPQTTEYTRDNWIADSQAPGYWMYETSGILRPAIEAYLNHDEMTPEHIAAMRDYLRQWIAGPWPGYNIERLRAQVDGLLTRVAIKRWLDAALDEGIDPL